MHWANEEKWPTAYTKQPVDWGYWCKIREFGSFGTVDNIGAQAFMPGGWRNGMTMQQAIVARKLAHN